jgi:HK97 family phage portal protein
MPSPQRSVPGWLARTLDRLAPSRTQTVPAPPHTKASLTGPLLAFEALRQPVWAPRDYAAFAREGFAQNAIAYRSVRMVAEAAASVPLLLYEGDQEISEHPLLDLIARPNPICSAPDLLESWYGFLLVSGNAYLEAVALGGQLRELHALRPDRMKVIPGPDGWPEAFEYTAGGRAVRFAGEVVAGVRPILHVKLFHPTNDHYGLSPIEAAATAIDIHNTASRWNKALLDNSARPSGALVYTSRDGNLTVEQYDRLKAELEQGFQGAAHAGRPLLLEGGLDWKSMSLTPKDMDFIEAKHVAAREIALALGVPPMLLGIPGDNTYSNYQEATRSLWRQTVLPLVNRTAKALSTWLSPAFGGLLDLRPDLDAIEALSTEREALWTRIDKATFLTPNEKRAAVGYGPLEVSDPPGLTPSRDPSTPKFNPYHDDRGRFTFAPDGAVQEANLRRRLHELLRRQPKPSEQPLQDILKPDGKELGFRNPGAREGIRTIEPEEFDTLKSRLLDGAEEVPAPKEYEGRWFQRRDGTIIGVRDSKDSGPTLDVIEGGSSGLRKGYKVHRK